MPIRDSEKLVVNFSTAVSTTNLTFMASITRRNDRLPTTYPEVLSAEDSDYDIFEEFGFINHFFLPNRDTVTHNVSVRLSNHGKESYFFVGDLQAWCRL